MNRINWRTMKGITSPGQISRYSRLLKEGNRSIAISEEERKKYLEKKNGPDIGPRGKFIRTVGNSDLSIEEDIENFIKDNKAFSRDDVIKWIREELKRGKASEKTLHKIELYLRTLEQEKVKESDDDAR